MKWSEYKLGNLITIKHGFAFKGEFFSEEPSKSILLTPGNFKIGGGFKSNKLKYYCGDLPSDYILSSGDVVVTMTDLSKLADTLGYSAKVPNDDANVYLHNQRIGLVELIDQDFDIDFLYWLMRSQHYQKFVAGSATGATVKHTSPSKIYAFKFKAPIEKQTQQKIAHILSAYDDLIENNLKRIKLLEEVAQITYEQWFVRMKFPGHESTPIDAETGLPEGSKEIYLDAACAVSGGGTPSREVGEYWEKGDITWFTPTDLSKANNLVLLDSANKITKKGLAKSSARLMQSDSFMMTSRATIGLFGLIDKPFSTNQGFINVTPHKVEDKYYLLFNFKSRVPEFYNHASGATFPEISKSKFKRLKIIWPTDELIDSWHKVVSPIVDSIFNLTQQNERLKEARDILLPRLMTGMISVDHIKLPKSEPATVAA